MLQIIKALDQILSGRDPYRQIARFTHLVARLDDHQKVHADR